MSSSISNPARLLSSITEYRSSLGGGLTLANGLYSRNLAEVEFCELPHYRVLRSSPNRRSRKSLIDPVRHHRGCPAHQPGPIVPRARRAGSSQAKCVGPGRRCVPDRGTSGPIVDGACRPCEAVNLTKAAETLPSCSQDLTRPMCPSHILPPSPNESDPIARWSRR